MKKILISLMALFTASLILMNVAHAEGRMIGNVNWQEYGAAAFKEAKKTHRLVVVFGEAEWCPYCRATKERVLVDPLVLQVLNKYYVPVILDVDKEPMLANQYNIYQLPTFVILNSNRKVVKTFAGFMEPQDMAARLEGIAVTRS